MELSILNTNLTANIASLTAISVGSLTDLDARLINTTNKIVRYSASATSGDYAPDAGGGYWVFHSSLILELVADGYDHAGNSKTNVSSKLTLYRDYLTPLCSDYNHVRSLAAEQLTAKLWANCTNEERLYLTDIFAKADGTSRADDYTTKIAFMESYLSVSTAAAKVKWSEKWAVHQHKNIDSCLHRWHSDAMHSIPPKYLTLDDVEDFLDTTYTQSGKFIGRGLKTDLLSYINTTLTTEAWTPKDGQALADMRDEILLVIDTGIH